MCRISSYKIRNRRKVNPWVTRQKSIRKLLRNGNPLKNISVSIKINASQSISFQFLWEYSRYDSYIYYSEIICKPIRYNIPGFSNENDVFDVHHLEMTFLNNTIITPKVCILTGISFDTLFFALSVSYKFFKK